MPENKPNLSEEHKLIEDLLRSANELVRTVSDPLSNDPTTDKYTYDYHNLNEVISEFHSLTPADLVRELERLSKKLIVPEGLSEVDFREKDIGYHIGLTAQKLEVLRKQLLLDPVMRLMNFEINQKEILKNQTYIKAKFEELLKKNNEIETSFLNAGYKYEVGDEKSNDPKLLIQVIKEKTVFVTGRASDIEDNLRALRAIFQLVLIAIDNITESSIRTLLWLQSKLVDALEWAGNMFTDALNGVSAISSNAWSSLKTNIAETLNQISNTIEIALSNIDATEEKSKPDSNLRGFFVKPISPTFLGRFNRHDVAVKMGVSNTVIYVKGHGIRLNQPSIVGIPSDKPSSRENVLENLSEVGADVFHKNQPTIFRPMRDGVIVDYVIAEYMLSNFFKMLYNRKVFSAPRVVICTPSGATQVERRALRQCAEFSGAKNVYLLERPMAAAIGAGLQISRPEGVMIVDIGGGTTEVAVLSLDGIVYSRSIRVGGDKMDDAIIHHVARETDVFIGERSAEKIKKQIGSAMMPSSNDGPTILLKSRSREDGLPKEVQVTEAMIAESLVEPVEKIIESIKMALEATPPELARDIVEKGLTLSGGGALLRNLDQEIRNKIGIPVSVAADPIFCSARGAGEIVEDLKKWRNVLSEA